MTPSRFRRLSSYLILGLLLTVSGCFPFSCQPRESRALFPSDSLSRQLAEAIAVDTLTTLWETRGNSDHPLSYPRTVRFGTRGTIYVSDAKTNKILEFLPEDGTLERVHTSISYDTPYIVGIRQDTILVLNPTARRIDFTVGDETALHTKLPEDPSTEGLRYATASDDHIYIKLLGENFDGYVAQLNHAGATVKKIPVSRPHWRYAGLMRMWGDSLISFSGFRPVIDIMDGGDALDSLALVGFDSPMLARSRAYALGYTRQPPLLYSSAAPLSDLIFVLNLRPGWLRIDVFDQEGNLVNRLVQEGPGFNKNFYPIDIDVRMNSEGIFELAVAYVEPEPKITLYSWKSDQ